MSSKYNMSNKSDMSRFSNDLERAAMDIVKESLSQMNFDVSCPNCATDINISSGANTCPRCGAKIDFKPNIDIT